MSVDYYFACGHCKAAIHVAQDGLSGFTFYRGEPDCMRALGDFLRAHRLCEGRIEFLPEHHVEDFEDADWKPEPVRRTGES
jgi:hypothetical protein